MVGDGVSWSSAVLKTRTRTGNPSFNPGWSIEQCVEDLLARAETEMTHGHVDTEQWLIDLDYLRRRKIAEWRP